MLPMKLHRGGGTEALTLALSTKPAILAGTPDEPKLDVKSGEGIEPLASFDVSGATLDYQNPYFELRLSGKDAATKALINKPSFTESKSKGVDTQIGEDENGWYVRYTVAQLKGGQFIEFPGQLLALKMV